MTGPAENAWARRLGWGLLALVGLFIILTFDQHGISNDEEVQHVYGRLLVDFYASGFVDQGAFHYKNLYLYGGFFDLIAALLERTLPLPVWDMRHLLSALFGLAGLAGAWRLGRLLGGEGAGLAALVILVLTGAWSGGMFTHTKDVPFATCMVWALYYITRLVPELPRPSQGLVLRFGVAVGCAIGLRVGAVFAVFYLVLTVLAVALARAEGGWRGRLAFVARSAWALVPSAAVALVLMGLFWPWSVMAPGNLLEAARAFSHFEFSLHTLLAGQDYLIGAVPRTYLLTYLAVRLPELLLAGAAAALVLAVATLGRPGGKRGRWVIFVPLAVAVAFPLVFTLATRPALYNGIRHFLFVVPPLAVLAGLGWWALLARAGGLRLPLGLLALALVAFHGVTLARLHPYQYLYYNQVVGGLPGAEDRWEMDYWSDALRPVAERLNRYVAAEPEPAEPWPVAVCAESIQGAAYLGPRFEVTRDWRKAEFFLSTTHLDCDTAVKGAIVATVARMGVPLAVARDRRGLTGAARDPRIPQ
ncbi:MAG: hypothetical protein RBS40_07210 [Rhodocyclaceae bacterium]|nr:hypothetical protein [Rhodocyclaceae bacterium]